MPLRDSLREALHIAEWMRDQQIQRIKVLRAAEIHQQCLKTNMARELSLLLELSAQVVEIAKLCEFEMEEDVSQTAEKTPESLQAFEQLSLAERNLLRRAAEVTVALPRDSQTQVRA